MSALRFVLVLLLITALWVPGSVLADESVCVSNVTGLVAALASFDTQPDSTLTIRLVQGDYPIGNALGGELYNQHSTVSLQVLGGYTAGCAGREIDPANTIIDGLDENQSGFGFIFNHDASALLEGLTFTRMHSFNSPLPAAAIDLAQEVGEGDSGTYVVRYCRFIGNTGHGILGLSGPIMTVFSSVFADNNVTSSTAGVIWAQMNYEANNEVVVTNNTLANNIGTALLIDEFDESTDRISDVSDNIFWGNTHDFSLLDVHAGNPPLLESYNIISTLTGLAPATTDLAVDPRFNAGLDNYTLALNSPAINSGDPFPLFGWPALDAAGNPRVVGSRVDRGAYESTVDDRSEAIVTTSADNGDNVHPQAGSLRAAIKTGNAAAGPFRISFALSGACGQILEIAAPMLDITGNVTIDGTTQSGWTANTSRDVFDANLCILLNGAGNSNTPWALHVPSTATNARLTVQGMMFAGFSDAAIKLEGGNAHRIFGNQFGAIAFTVPNHQAIRVTGESGGAFIGDYANAAAVNLIAGSTDSGIDIDNASGGSTIASNLIGFQIDGTTNGGNGTGVFIFESPDNNLQLNVIGYSATTGIEIAGPSATGNIVQANTIGSNRALASAPNATDGVQLDFGASANTIGAPLDSTDGGNAINDNGGPGVWVGTTAGNGNCVLENAFTGNGGLDIDLAAAGPTQNQPSSPGSNANRLQNYPVLTSALYAAGTVPKEVVAGQLQSVPNATFRLDFYYAQTYGPDGRGLAQIDIGSATVTTNGSGIAVFAIEIPITHHPVATGVVTATATDMSGDTSEVGNVVVERSDRIFADGFDP